MNKMLNYFQFINEAKTDNESSDLAAKYVKLAYKYLLIKCPMWITFFSKLRIAEDSSIKTMCTDGKSILYNPSFVIKLGEAKTAFVLVHEILHNVNCHFARQDDRNVIVFDDEDKPTSLWNIACDYAINPMIKEMIEDHRMDKSSIDVPENILLDDKYKDMSAVHIYEELLKELKDKQQKNQNQQQNQQMRKIEVGDKVKIKATGELGKVSKINPDGSFEVDTNITEGFLFESYSAQDVVLIIPKSDSQDSQDSQGSGSQKIDPNLTVEYEDDGKGNKSDQNDGSGKKSDGQGEVFDKNVTKDIIKGNQIGSDIQKAGSLDGKGETLFEGDSDLQNSTNTEDVVKEWKKTRIETANKSKSFDKLSSNLRRWLDKISTTAVDWKMVLRKFAKDCVGRTYKMKNFNRRLINRDLYVKGLRPSYDIGINHAVIAFDTSGSIGDAELSLFASELKNIFTATKIENVDVVWCDADVKNTQRFDRSNKFSADKLVPAGGGGTDLRPPFDWTKKNIIDKKGKYPSLFIYFTDGDGTYPNKRDYKISNYIDNILWVIIKPNYRYEPTIPPFGKYIILDISEIYGKD